MKVTEADLRANYESLDTERLLELRGRGTLTEIAQRVLEQVLDERAVPGEQRARAASEVQERVAQEAELIASLASLGERAAAQIIDFFLALAALVACLLLSMAGLNVTMLGVLLFIGYLLLADGLPRGQSLGKRILSIAVVHQRTREPCTYMQSVLRNFFSLLLGAIDWLCIFGRARQRLGDMAANTIVVRVRPRGEALHAF